MGAGHHVGIRRAAWWRLEVVLWNLLLGRLLLLLLLLLAPRPRRGRRRRRRCSCALACWGSPTSLLLGGAATGATASGRFPNAANDYPALPVSLNDIAAAPHPSRHPENAPLPARHPPAATFESMWSCEMSISQSSGAGDPGGPPGSRTFHATWPWPPPSPLLLMKPLPL